MSVSQEQVLNALQGFVDPYFPGRNLVARKAIRALRIDGGKVNFTVALGYPAAGVAESLRTQLADQVKTLPGVESVVVELEWAIAASKTQNNLPALASVKNIIAVASGKGGVGKSTTAVNLALALAAEGASVGILDADIYGPSLPLMLGIAEDARPETVDNQYFLPMRAHGLQAMSMGFLITDKTPMVWRGPMVSGALQQMLGQTRWQDLDYLIVDMPPGTGDIQLTLAQKVPVTGAVVVTTPQDIALLDAIKGIEMFRKVDIPVLGIVENMALHVCSHCGHVEHIFGAGGGERIAKAYEAPLLGSLPLDLAIRQQTDAGCPTVAQDADSENAQRYREIARKLAGALAARGRDEAVPQIIFKAD